MATEQVTFFESWMARLFQVALADRGEDRMLCESWYYINKNIWQQMFLAGLTPEEAYEEDEIL